MKIALRFVEGTLAGQVKEAFLYDKKHVLVGRDPQANIVLPEQDRTASTTHAKIVFDRGDVWINDVGSHYGTFVNHKPTPRSKIKHGDFIRFGAKGPLAEFLVVPDGQTIATPVQKPAAPVERSAQSPSGAPISKRPKPAATRMMAAPTPEMLALLAGDVASSVAAAAGAPMPPQAPAAPHAFPAPSPVPRGPAGAPGAGGGYGAPVVVLPAPGQARGPGGAPPIPMPMPVPMPRPQPVPPPAAAPMPAEPASGRPPRGGKTQVGMSAMMNPAMRRRLEQQGKMPDEADAGPPPQGAPSLPTYGDLGAPAYVLGEPPPQAQPAPLPMPYPGPAPAPAPADDTKECPFCAERIKKAALKCRFCGEFLTTTQNKANDPDAPPVMDERMFAMPKDGRGASVAALSTTPPLTLSEPPPQAEASRRAGAAPTPAFPPAPLAARAPATAPAPAPAPAPWPPSQSAAPSAAPAPAPSDAAPSFSDEAPHWDLPSLDDDGPAPGQGG